MRNTIQRISFVLHIFWASTVPRQCKAYKKENQADTTEQLHNVNVGAVLYCLTVVKFKTVAKITFFSF